MNCKIQVNSMSLQADKKNSADPGIPGTGTPIVSYIRRLGSFFRVHNFEFHYFWGGFRKMYEDFVDIFWGSSQNWTLFRGNFYAF